MLEQTNFNKWERILISDNILNYVIRNIKVNYHQWPGAPHWRIYHCSFGQLSTTCSNATEIAQWAAPSYSRPQPAIVNDVRDARSNCMVVTFTWQCPLSVICTCNCALQIKSVVRGFDPGTSRTQRLPHCLCGQSGIWYNIRLNNSLMWQLLSKVLQWITISKDLNGRHDYQLATHGKWLLH